MSFSHPEHKSEISLLHIKIRMQNKTACSAVYRSVTLLQIYW